jgi:hypothetical protein
MGEPLAIPVLQGNHPEIPFTRKSPEKAALEAKLANDLAHISVLNGQFDFEDKAYKWYNDWYLDRSRFPMLMDNRLQGYYMRKHIHVLKVAMALSLAENDSLLLQERDLTTALALLEEIEVDMKSAFSAVGGNLMVSDMDRILNQIKQEEGMDYGDILAHNLHALPSKEIDAILQNLVDMGEVVRTIKLNEGGRAYYRPG